MYIQPAKPLRTADPILRARDAYTTAMRSPGITVGVAAAPRDRFNLSDESRLREEYGLRFVQESRRKRRKRKTMLPTLPDMARLYAGFLEEVRNTFRNHAGNLIAHAQALDFAWRDTLEGLAQKEAENLAWREGDPSVANTPLLAEIIGKAYGAFADAFCASLAINGVEQSIPSAVAQAVKVLTLVQNYELSLSDTMALLYFRKGLEV